MTFLRKLLTSLASISSWPISDKLAFWNCIFTCLFLLATIISVFFAFKAYKHQKQRAKKEAACDLAKYYAENVIKRYSFVRFVMQVSGLEKRVKDLFPYDKLCHFDKNEMIKFLEKKEVSYEDISNEFNDISPAAILSAKLIFSETIDDRHNLINEYLASLDKEPDIILPNNPKILQIEFFDSLYDFLNALEWFSMSCQYGIADEEILYQSLHKTFLSTVWLLYFYIAYQNVSNEDKLFTNIIWLFNKWHGRLYDVQQKAKKEQQKIEKKLDNANRKRIKVEEELNGVHPEVFTGKSLK